MKNIFKKLSLKTVVAVLVMFGLLTFVGFNYFVAKAEPINLFSTVGGSKTQVTPNDTLQYVVTLRNDGTETLHNVWVKENFDPQVSYVLGSAQAEKNGTTVSVIDNWVNTGTNLGTLNSGQTAYFKFNGKISNSATVGSTIQNGVDVKSDETSWVGKGFTVTVVSANQNAVLRSGDFLKVTNNTLQNGWQNSVSVSPYNVVEFLVKITNDGDNDARNVNLKANLPTNSVATQHPSVTLSADNAASVSDEVTVTSQFPFYFSYKIGHATLFGNTQLYNCPNGCLIPESFYLSPLNLGTVKPGESLSIQVTFKADIIPQFPPTPTPTPTATPTSTPTSTPTASPSPTPTNPPVSPNSSCTSLKASVTSGTKPLTVTFTGAGSDSDGSIQSYQFNFGDNSNGQDQIVTTSNNQVSHVYHNSGSYTANLIVKDSRGVWVGSGNTNCQVNINVNNPPQVLGATAPPALPSTGASDTWILLAAPFLIGSGVYIFRKFRLI